MKPVPDKLKAEELVQLKWLMGSVLTLLSLWSLWSLQFGLELLIVLGLVMVSFSVWRPQLLEKIPERLWTYMGPIILVGIVADFALNVSGRAEFLPPLVRMVMVLLIYRCLAPRKRREDLQLILLCLFCVVLAGVLSVSMLFAVQILLFMPLAMGLLFTICLLKYSDTDEPKVTFLKEYRVGLLFGRVRASLDYKFLGFGAFLFVCMVFVSSFIFILMPRFNLDQAIPFLQTGTTSKSGFSSEVRLGKVTEIRQDNSEAMRVDVPSLDAVTERPYWRMLVLDRYDAGFFRQSSDAASLVHMDVSRLESRLLNGWERWPVPFSEQTGATWTFYLEGGISQYLPLPGQFNRLRFSSAKELLRNNSLLTVQTDIVQQSVLSYQLEDLQLSSSVPATNDEVEAFLSSGAQTSSIDEMDGPSYPMSLLELLMPDVDRAYLAEINESLHGGERMNALEYGRLVVGHLYSNHLYSRSPSNGRGEGDEVVRWMREGGGGHCEYFSAAMILLAREAGYPARMAVGFAGGSWNSVEEYFVVRNSNAHAWVELYDAESKSWLRFDPTPGSDTSDTSVPFSDQVQIDVGMAAWVDSLRIQWYRRVVSFDQDDQLELAETAKGFVERAAKAISEGIRGGVESVKKWWGEIVTTGDWWRTLPMVLFAGLCWFCVRYRQFFGHLWYRVFRRADEMDPQRKQASVYIRKLDIKQAALDKKEGTVPGRFLAIRVELEAIRFGPEQDRVTIAAIFARAKRVL
jgi:hypothetical protein